MKGALFCAQTKFKVGFFDVDSMDVVWHGNYVKFLEVGRCHLLDEIGYNYNNMRSDGFAFPVVELKLKFVKSLLFDETATIKSYLIEYENRLKIAYEIFNEKGELVNKAESTQMVVKISTGETMFVCPENFTKKVLTAIEKSGGES
jgi:acyl-CoA thioester hydrolase